MKQHKFKPGDRFTVRFVTWDANWVNDAPIVFYHGIKRFCVYDHTRGFYDILSKVVSDFLNNHAGVMWTPELIKEFSWRGWEIKSFSTRPGTHYECTYEVKKASDGTLSARRISKKELTLHNAPEVLDGEQPSSNDSEHVSTATLVQF